MDMCVIAFILVVVCFYVLLPIAIISEIVTHLHLIFFVVSFIALGIVVIVQIKILIHAVRKGELASTIFSGLGVLCGISLIPAVCLICCDSVDKIHSVNPFTVIWVVVGILALYAYLTHAAIEYDLHPIFLGVITICLVAASIFTVLWSMGFYEAHMLEGDKTVKYATEYTVTRDFELYESKTTKSGKNHFLGSYAKGTTVTPYSHFTDVTAVIINRDAEPDEISTFIGPVTLLDGNHGYIAVYGQSIIDQYDKGGLEFPGTLRANIKSDILEISSKVSKLEMYQRRFKSILPVCRDLFNSVDFLGCRTYAQRHKKD